MKLEIDPGTKQAALAPHSRKTEGPPLRKTVILATILAATVLYLFSTRIYYQCSRPREIDVAKVQRCSIHNLEANLSFLDNAKPIRREEFIERQDRLANALANDGVDAFVLEPGYTFQ